MIYLQTVPSVTLNEARSPMVSQDERTGKIYPCRILLIYDGKRRASGIHSEHNLPGGKLQRQA